MMHDLISAAIFEIKSSLRKTSTYIYFGLFFAVATLAAFAMGGGIKGAVVSFGYSERMYINAPVAILSISTVFAAFGSSIIAAAFGQAVCKDYLANMDQVIYTKPIHIRGLLIGRFLGTLAVMSLVFFSVPLGIAFATLLPVQANMVTNASLFAYLQPMLVSVIPNIFIFGSIFFLLATITKRMAPVYVAGIFALMGWMLAGTLVSDIENKLISSLTDPFGLSGIDSSIKYWSVSDKQTDMVWWTGYYLYNRLTWVGLGLACLGHAIYHFVPISGGGRRNPDKTPAQPKPSVLPSVRQSIQGRTFAFSIFKMQLRLELKQAFKNIYFICICLAAIFHILIGSTQVGKMWGTNTYPVTYAVLTLLGGMMSFYMLVIVTFWCGELVWRDRETRFNQIIDSTPAPTWVLAASKFVTMNAITMFFMAVFMVVGILIQTFQGYYRYEIGQYVMDLFVMNFATFFFISALAIFFQVVTNNKYVGHGFMILFYVYRIAVPMLGYSDRLLRPSSAPMAPYSDMNGFGHFLYGYFTFQTLWMVLAAILILLAYWHWPRGTDGKAKWSWHALPMKRRKILSALAVAYALIASFIYYNTHILNEVLPTKEYELRRVDYEKGWVGFKESKQLTMVAVFPKVDIFPHQQSLSARTVFTLQNNTDKDLSEVFLNVPTGKDVKTEIRFSQDGATELKYDRRLGISIWTVGAPIPPHGTIQMSFKIDVVRHGFSNSADETLIVDNGSFIHNTDFLPTIGYDDSREIQSPKTREKYKLPPKPRMPPITDQANWNVNYATGNSHWVDFETIVSTSDDQTAIAPGYLVEDWVEEGRHYFHYKMDQKILNFYAFQSGKYAVKKDKWKNVDIEVYYHPEHTKNIDTMIEGVREGLAYYTENFSPFQYRQFRIIEFPRYATFAQSFPNTVPFSEGIGFIAKVDPNNPEDVNYPFYVTAHELAHQWWAHQVIGANVQGATVLSESLAQYSALMVMEKKYGRERMKKFLKYELEGYLAGRGTESEREWPLRLVENQGYIHYQKASLVFYTLKDTLGEDKLNAAISEFVKKYAFKGPPYPRSDDLINLIVAHAPDRLKEFVAEQFNSIVLYQNRVISAKSKKKPDGKYEVTMDVSVAKFNTDGTGEEKEFKVSNAIFDVGVRNKKGDFIYLNAHYFESGENLVTVEVDEEPARAGIDPISTTIDKNPSDNEMAVTTL